MATTLLGKKPRPLAGEKLHEMATWQAQRIIASLRSRQPVYQRAVPAADGRQRHRLQHEPIRDYGITVTVHSIDAIAEPRIELNTLSPQFTAIPSQFGARRNDGRATQAASRAVGRTFQNFGQRAVCLGAFHCHEPVSASLENAPSTRNHS
jgi:hypothetical protein